MIDLELKDLRMIKTIAETGSMTKAAELLRTSQPALSRQLQLLESRIGASLFNRLSKNMTLTDMGKEVLVVAVDILAKIDQAETTITRKLDGSAGTLNLGIHCTSAFTWLPDVLMTFQTKFPNVALTVNSTEDYVKECNSGKIDIAVTHLHHNDNQRGFRYEPLFSSNIIAIMSPAHCLAGKNTLSLTDFNHCNYLSMMEKADDPFYKYFLKPAGIEPDSFTMLNQAHALMAIVSSSQSLALLPEFVARAAVDSGQLKQANIEGVPLSSTWLIAHRASQPLSDHAREFIKLIREMAS